MLFSLEVEAQQANNPLRAARTRVEIAVEDVNDKTPLFKRNEYNVTLREDERVGKRVITVEAKDEDKVGGGYHWFDDGGGFIRGFEK